MGLVGDNTDVAPFANEAMRLLREDWQGKYGAKMLSEELMPILQTSIPKPDQNFTNNVTIYAGQNDAFMQFIDKFGNILYNIDGTSGLKPVETPGYPPPKLKPKIVWGPHTITAGSSISGTELDAVAVDPETGAEILGTYVYTPPDGTTFSSAGTSTLYVNFTPTDGVKYRRAMGSTVLTITGSGVKLVPDINWSAPADINVGTALSGTQLNATATDPITHLAVAGTFTYIPPSGTVLAAGATQGLEADFVPTDTVTYDNNSGFQTINVRHLGAILRVRVSENATSQVQVSADVPFLFASPTGSGTVTVTSLIGRTYTDDFTLAYDIGTGIFTTVHTASASNGTPTGITPGTNPATVANNVGTNVNSLQSGYSGASFEVNEHPGLVDMSGIPIWVSWIDS